MCGILKNKHKIGNFGSNAKIVNNFCTSSPPWVTEYMVYEIAFSF